MDYRFVINYSLSNTKDWLFEKKMSDTFVGIAYLIPNSEIEVFYNQTYESNINSKIDIMRKCFKLNLNKSNFNDI